MMKLLELLKKLIEEVLQMNSSTAKSNRLTYYATQIDLGWITIDEVPKRYREDVAKLIAAKEASETTEQEG